MPMPSRGSKRQAPSSAAGANDVRLPPPEPEPSRGCDTLATAGARWPHVVHVNSYHVGGFPPVINETMAKLYRHYMPDRAPIWTQLGIEALWLPTMRIEIRVTAIIA